MSVIQRHQAEADGDVDDVTHSLCKLLAALGEHSTGYIVANIASTRPVSVAQDKTKGALSQLFVQAMLAFVGLPGHFGIDEETSDQALAFWFELQESIWDGDDGDEDQQEGGGEAEKMVVMKAVYVELVKVLKRKVTIPLPGKQNWTKGMPIFLFGSTQYVNDMNRPVRQVPGVGDLLSFLCSYPALMKS